MDKYEQLYLCKVITVTVGISTQTKLHKNRSKTLHIGVLQAEVVARRSSILGMMSSGNTRVATALCGSSVEKFWLVTEPGGAIVGYWISAA